MTWQSRSYLDIYHEDDPIRNNPAEGDLTGDDSARADLVGNGSAEDDAAKENLAEGDPVMADLVIVLADGGDLTKANELAIHCAAKDFIEAKTDDIGSMLEKLPRNTAALVFDCEGVYLTANGMYLRPDFSKMLARLRSGSLNKELLVRAAKSKAASRSHRAANAKAEAQPWAIDATAGFGEDAFLIAAAGFKVSLYERNPVIAQLLRDAMRRAQEIPELRDALSRMTLVEQDSIKALNELAANSNKLAANKLAANKLVENGLAANGLATNELGELDNPPDLIYLDPMFPQRQKSAAVRKKFQILHLLEKPCSDSEALLRAAISTGARKLVIKRPPKGEYLAGIRPDYSLKTKAVRYDCIIPAQRI